jgi:hypothetical protein
VQRGLDARRVQVIRLIGLRTFLPYFGAGELINAFIITLLALLFIILTCGVSLGSYVVETIGMAGALE